MEYYVKYHILGMTYQMIHSVLRWIVLVSRFMKHGHMEVLIIITIQFRSREIISDDWHADFLNQVEQKKIQKKREETEFKKLLEAQQKAKRICRV